MIKKSVQTLLSFNRAAKTKKEKKIPFISGILSTFQLLSKNKFVLSLLAVPLVRFRVGERSENTIKDFQLRYDDVADRSMILSLYR